MNRAEKIFTEIDNLLIDGKEIDKYENWEFKDQIKPVQLLQDDVIDFLFGESKVTGLQLPWYGLEDTIRFRPGELTIWNGINGHGKSMMLCQAFIGFMRQGSICAMASLELKPVETLVRMIGQSWGIEKVELQLPAIEQFFPKIEDQFYLYTETGDLKPKRVLALARYVREELNVEHLGIDSLMKCGIREDDYSGQADFVNTLQNVAKDTGLHIHLVTHSKKQKDEYEKTGKFDIKGSGGISDLADNVLTVTRNKKKELEKRMDNPNEEILKQKDAFLTCDKQRHDNWEGVIGLYFHPSGQYSRQEGQHRPML